MGKRRSVQLLLMQAPLRKVFVHDRDETIVVMPLGQVREFVNNDVLDALHRLLSEFEVQPDASGVGGAAPHFVFIFLIRQSPT